MMQSKGSSGYDRTAFYGAKVPQEVKAMIKPLSKLEKTTFRKILKLVVNVLNGKVPTHQQVQTLVDDALSEETLAVVYAGLAELLRRALRVPSSSLKQEAFMQDLQELQLTEEQSNDLAAVVFGPGREGLDACLTDGRPRAPSLDSLDWRVDVAISTGVLSRVLVRGVTVDLALSNGKSHNFEMSEAKFQDLRFQVASVLSEMERLEKRSIFKIKD